MDNPLEEVENDDITISQEEYVKLKRAFELLEIVADDYENYGEVLQYETVEEMEKFFEELEESNEENKKAVDAWLNYNPKEQWDSIR